MLEPMKPIVFGLITSETTTHLIEIDLAVVDLTLVALDLIPIILDTRWFLLQQKKRSYE